MSATYELAFTESAALVLDQLAENEQQKMQKAFAVLREDPFHPKSQPVHESDPTVREVSPTANSLAIYHVLDNRWAVITILRINHDSLI